MCYDADCQIGTADCDQNATNGCETDTSSDPQNCGGCDNVCLANEECQFGLCRNPDCGFGEGDCDGDANNGCEADLFDDAANCGRCDNACGPNDVCTFGFCRPDF